MFIPSAKSNLSLLILLVISVILFIWVENSRVFVSDRYYEEKLAAAELMQSALDLIKKHRLEERIFIDEVNDPNMTALIGEKQSLIVTDRGDLREKLTSLNPNFAAAILELFKEAGLQKNDLIAVSSTGSFPGLNIALMSAAKVLNLEVVMITSVGSSMFGATDPDFTWLDMEKLLYDRGIFPYRSIAASIGGGRDLGRGLNKIGRESIVENIDRNNIQLVQENSLEKNIQRKMDLFRRKSDKEYNLYVNIGGGLSSLGISLNGRLISSGFHRYLTLKNTPLKGTMLLFADNGIPVIHLLDVNKFAEDKLLPEAPTPLPKPGTGSMFEIEKYNVNIAVISLIILIILILIVILFDHRELKIKDNEINV